ncbi:MAG: hypothetical protein AAGF84_02305 [Planctomycetota bacterium]
MSYASLIAYGAFFGLIVTAWIGWFFLSMSYMEKVGGPLLALLFISLVAIAVTLLSYLLFAISQDMQKSKGFMSVVMRHGLDTLR